MAALSGHLTSASFRPWLFLRRRMCFYSTSMAARLAFICAGCLEIIILNRPPLSSQVTQANADPEQTLISYLRNNCMTINALVPLTQSSGADGHQAWLQRGRLRRMHSHGLVLQPNSQADRQHLGERVSHAPVCRPWFAHQIPSLLIHYQ